MPRSSEVIAALEGTVSEQRRRLTELETELAKRRADDVVASRRLGVPYPEPGTPEARAIALVRELRRRYEDDLGEPVMELVAEMNHAESA